ncbi:hypothetical protein GCM10028818_60170 [Spirosoma horti]
MNRHKLWTALAFCIIFSYACKKETVPQAPVNLVKNGDMEADPSQNWVPYYGYEITTNPNGYLTAYTTEAAASGTHSIKVSCTTVKNDSTFLYFYQQFLPQTLKPGDKLTLKAKIKTVNLRGAGISLAIRGDKYTNGQTSQAFFSSTQSQTVINGTNDFKEYSITTDAYPGNADRIGVFLLYLNKTTGTAYFDDVSLTVN